MTTIKTMYCLGIGGAGVSGLARLAKQHGVKVVGSEITETAIVKKLRQEGITVHVPQQASNVPLDYDLYVYSDAVPDNNPERIVIQQPAIQAKSLSYFKAVGQFMKVYKNRIAVSGTHGKTTTTAMLTLVLQAAGLDPSAVIGSVVRQLGSNACVGKTLDYFVAEACEYKAHMLELFPTTIILTNIEEDHLDYFRDLEHIEMTFQEYINRLPSNGVLVRNTDDSESCNLDFNGTTISYGIHAAADVMAHDIQKQGHKQTFKVGTTRYTLSIPGDFNIYNALAVIAYAQHLGIPEKTIQTALQSFSGTWRRFEVVGNYHQATVISDYAHHPTAVRATIKATREFYPDQRVVVVFQPHQHNRTKRLFNDFISAFDLGDLIIIQEIYDVAGREAVEDQTVSSRDLVAAIEKTGKLVLYSPDQTKTKQLLAEHVEPKDVVLVVGAGDIYLVAEEIIKA